VFEFCNFRSVYELASHKLKCVCFSENRKGVCEETVLLMMNTTLCSHRMYSGSVCRHCISKNVMQCVCFISLGTIFKTLVNTGDWYTDNCDKTRQATQHRMTLINWSNNSRAPQFFMGTRRLPSGNISRLLWAPVDYNNPPLGPTRTQTNASQIVVIYEFRGRNLNTCVYMSVWF